ncbi:hypothetical protein [Bradyrhizobium sp.]|jgi:hypothetical protein|uniref:hypothetical protein n=1 Tax=Bradyrhizobium sp. TaxID=376 RepID=UPI002D75B61D|nr:hypothetical protein [Bradyrhizobium sp.]HZR76836.1 hypothetical protein [Bradyrhizobium sp.]
MDLIWVKREAIYFFGEDWTGSISLIWFQKLADWRKLGRAEVPSAAFLLWCAGARAGINCD